MVILQILFTTAFFVIVPCILGSFWTVRRPVTPHTVFVMLLSGLAAMLALFEVIVIPCVLLGVPYGIFCWGFTIFLLALSVFLLVRNRKHFIESFGKLLRNLNGWGFAGIFVLILIGVQIFVPVWFRANTGWNPTAAVIQTSISTDTMLKFDAYTGQQLSGLQLSEVIFPLPLLYGIVSKITGISPALLLYTLMPAVWISFAYAAQLMTANVLLDGKQRQETVYMFFVCMLTMFGFYSNRSLFMKLLQESYTWESIIFCILIPSAAALVLTAVKKPRAAASGATAVKKKPSSAASGQTAARKRRGRRKNG
ncbi:DUF6077 domain-containing protein [Murimonas intestini]|uniref:Uncharacterized protein n=1 Tax=Murimonas intestini TaxID=1337051 RepID=A0AB73SYZ8_9FIRM|nr:DUF6077 domain-containing protein [Murimonas intestini]MCR1842989.1 DUF6077 domain-containing protein [Murimonas intestini]MCR1867990.1 DUF6077 domain-containing protein [Murimonas intestini]MCR1885458.1 DUF6077 domain-containing protein [Murimonas intestini]